MEKKKKALPLCPVYEKRRQRRVQSMQVTRDLWKPQPLSTSGGITLWPGLLPTLPSAEHGPETAAHFLGSQQVRARVEGARNKAADSTDPASRPDDLETSKKGKHKPSSCAQRPIGNIMGWTTASGSQCLLMPAVRELASSHWVPHVAEALYLPSLCARVVSLQSSRFATLISKMPC